MTPEALLEKIESTGKVEDKIIGKLRRQLENPDKKVTVKKILSFLVKNELITKEEAAEFRQPIKKRSETDDLLVGVGEVAEVKEVEEVAPEPVAPAPAPVAVPEMVDYGQDLMAEAIPEAPMPAAAPIADPMSSWDAPASGAAAAADGQQKSAGGFSGKVDSRDQWRTKWIYIGPAVLGMILVVGALVSLFLTFETSERKFEIANTSFENSTYGDAIEKFTDFLDDHPGHEKAPIAKVKLAHAKIRNAYSRDNWDETVVQCNRELPPLVEDEEVNLDEIRNDLAVMLPKTVFNLAVRATKIETKEELIVELDKAKQARTSLLDNPVYLPNSKRKQASVAKTLDDIAEEIAKGDGLIRKQDDFAKAMTDIQTARGANETDKAFTIYNNLIRDYGDLRANEDLQAEMKQVSAIEAQLVVPAETGLPVTSDLRPSPIESSVILAANVGQPIESLVGEVAPVLADGAVYGVDIGSGRALWRRYVGYQTIVQPRNIGPKKTLVADQLNNDLLMVNSKDGQIIWRMEIGESFLEPQIEESQMLLTCDSGKLFKVDLESGQAVAGATIPQNTNVPMSGVSRSGKIYQPGFYSNLYVLSGEDLTCSDVYYLGHYRGSIAVPPVVWNNHVLVAINQSGVCDLRVLRPDPESGVLIPVQRIRQITRGIVTNPLVRFGRFMLINSESGDLKILELNTANEIDPIRVLKEEKFDNRDGRRTYITTAGSQMWIAAKGIKRYKVSRAQSTFKRQAIADSDDYFTGPVRKVGEALVHVRKRFGSALTSVAAVNAETLEQIWRTDLGGPLAGPPMVTSNGITAISTQGDLFSINQLDGTDQVASEAVKSSNILKNLLFDEILPLTESTSVCLGPPGKPEILYVDTASGKSKLITLTEPASDSASRGILIDGSLIIPTRQGQVVRINPANGRDVGTPFLPAVSPGTTVQWRRPVDVGGSRFLIGAASDLYLIDASNKRSLSKAAELVVDGKLKMPLAASGEIAFGVYEIAGDENLMAINVSGGSLAAGSTAKLPATVTDGPWVVGDQVLVRLDSNEIISFDASLKELWSADLGAGTLASAPLAENGAISLYFNDGRYLQINPSNGNIDSNFNLGQPIAAPPVNANGKFLFPGLDGTLHSVPRS